MKHKGFVGLTLKQLEALPTQLDTRRKPVRFMCEGKAISLSCGALTGGNVINQPIYWDRPKEFIAQALRCLRENNHSMAFRVTYH